MERFSFAVTRHGEDVEVALSGELDMAVSGQVEVALDDAIGSAAAVTVDCSQLAFLDSAGLRILLHALRIAQRAGVAFRLRALPPALHRVFELAGVDGVFPLDPLDAPSAEGGR